MATDSMIYRLSARDPAAVEFFTRVADIFVREGGSRDFSRLAGFGTTEKARRRSVRDAALVRLACLLGNGYPASQLTVSKMLRKFEIEHWPSWRVMKAPPSAASGVEAACWAVFKAGGVPRSAQGIGRIIRAQKRAAE